MMLKLISKIKRVERNYRQRDKEPSRDIPEIFYNDFQQLTIVNEYFIRATITHNVIMSVSQTNLTLQSIYRINQINDLVVILK